MNYIFALSALHTDTAFYYFLVFVVFVYHPFILLNLFSILVYHFLTFLMVLFFLLII